MEVIWSELSAGLPDSRQFAVVVVRLVMSALLGAAIGFEREKAGKAAGLRTHILVTTGTTVFILASTGAGMGGNSDAMSRVIQGIITGIGFVGAGAILKLDREHEIRGLTTATGIWMACAIGVAVALGVLGLAIMATIFTLIALRTALILDRYIDKSSTGSDPGRDVKS